MHSNYFYSHAIYIPPHIHQKKVVKYYHDDQATGDQDHIGLHSGNTLE